ncbi:exodeoxyribonuclease VII small subunit [Megasphaera vaginalis (ex Srinivasan et al. 2021)]|uniref:Exodeoxyribonuclease 7 small subunit n=1 Tax=Megasphaera vaginalis (ex Srinivasan et al. 2021) TaxID=1111454 RepID=U7UB05_9FIRM|nr:exodeoxyribonuclease VII small subunit [Megasphaera vaginalis (ex Srinivasan et al. 2021)]ERT56627.1 exodeoxyribonuclease VII, small subunit [Megasphaera vaginalis (ex Srinivasan et al. 2021)]
MARTTDKLKSFESNYEKLEELVASLENTDLTLKESLDLFEKAISLSQTCESALTYAKQRAEALADLASPVVSVDEERDESVEEGTLDL